MCLMNLLHKYCFTPYDSLFSCQSKEQQLVGHWHEYQKGNPDFLSCHKITDSTYSLDSETFGGSYVIKRAPHPYPAHLPSYVGKNQIKS